MDLKGEIMRCVEALPLDLQHQLLAYCDVIEQTSPRGERGTALLSFAGSLDDTSAAEMSEAIASACETVDTRDW